MKSVRLLVLNAECWVLTAVCWMLTVECWLLTVECYWYTRLVATKTDCMSLEMPMITPLQIERKDRKEIGVKTQRTVVYCSTLPCWKTKPQVFTVLVLQDRRMAGQTNRQTNAHLFKRECILHVNHAFYTWIMLKKMVSIWQNRRRMEAKIWGFLRRKEPDGNWPKLSRRLAIRPAGCLLWLIGAGFRNEKKPI